MLFKHNKTQFNTYIRFKIFHVQKNAYRKRCAIYRELIKKKVLLYKLYIKTKRCKIKNMKKQNKEKKVLKTKNYWIY